MQRDNQGRALLRLPTTMRVAFAAAQLAAMRVGAPYPAALKAVGNALLSNHGYRKVPAWTVTRKAGR